jgi:hypothetical protein
MACIKIATILAIPAPAAPASSEGTNMYRSPDGGLRAVIVPIGREHRVEIRNRHGKVLASVDRSSEDGEHGGAVEKAAWSPDAQFFVFSTYNSGGHAAWTSPTFLYDRRLSKLFNLDCFLPPVAASDFTIRAPDILTITIWSPFTRGLSGSIALPVTVKLSSFRQVPGEPLPESEQECARR